MVSYGMNLYKVLIRMSQLIKNIRLYEHAQVIITKGKLFLQNKESGMKGNLWISKRAFQKQPVHDRR